MTVEVVPRSSWCTTPANGTPAAMALPAPRTWLHHGGAGTSSVATANAYARGHIAGRGFHDIGYSWLIAEGLVLEGRGPGRVGAHTHADNSRSHGICMVGSYTTRPPADRDVDALIALLRHGATSGWWPSPTLTGGHRDAPGASTQCPGAALHRLIPAINARAREEDVMSPAQEARFMARLDAQDAAIRQLRTDLEDVHLRPLRRGVRALMGRRGIETSRTGQAHLSRVEAEDGP